MKLAYAPLFVAGCVNGAPLESQQPPAQVGSLHRVLWERHPSLSGGICSFALIDPQKAKLLTGKEFVSGYIYLLWPNMLSNSEIDPKTSIVAFSAVTFEVIYREKEKYLHIGAGFMGRYSRSDQSIPVVFVSAGLIEKMNCETGSDI